MIHLPAGIHSLRVAIDVTPTIGAGYGIGRLVGDLLPHLARLVELHGVYQGHHGPLPNGIRRHLAGAHRYDLAGGRVGAYLRLPGILDREGIHLYHSTSTIAVPGPGWSGAVVGTVYDCFPLTSEAPYTFRHRRLFRGLLSALVRRAVLITVPSAASRQELLEHHPGVRTVIVPPGIEPVSPVPRPAGAPERYVLSVGAIEPRKGLQDLARQLGGADLPPWYHVGGIRADPGGAIAAEMDASGCRRLGWVEDRQRDGWLQHAAAVLCPSRREGFGLPLLEAMAAGVPVVATAAGGPQAETIGDAWTVVPAEGLLNELRLLLGDSALRERRILAGLQRAATLSAKASAQALVRIYRQVTISS